MKPDRTRIETCALGSLCHCSIFDAVTVHFSAPDGDDCDRLHFAPTWKSATAAGQRSALAPAAAAVAVSRRAGPAAVRVWAGTTALRGQPQQPLGPTPTSHATEPGQDLSIRPTRGHLPLRPPSLIAPLNYPSTHRSPLPPPSACHPTTFQPPPHPFRPLSCHYPPTVLIALSIHPVSPTPTPHRAHSDPFPPPAAT